VHLIMTYVNFYRSLSSLSGANVDSEKEDTRRKEYLLFPF
jgi:hypothetical protein